MNAPNPQANFFEGEHNASHLEYWSGFIFTESVGDDLYKLTSPEIRERAQKSIFAASVFLYELNEVQKTEESE